jgi:hypothetical protein
LLDLGKLGESTFPSFLFLILFLILFLFLLLLLRFHICCPNPSSSLVACCPLLVA